MNAAIVCDQLTVISEDASKQSTEIHHQYNTQAF